MKKILFIFITIFMGMNIVNANEWQEEILEGDNVLKEIRYRFYKEREVGEYLTLDNKSEYEYMDLDNYILSDYGEYKSSCSEEEYDVEYKTKYTYKKLLPVNYIRIVNENYMSNEMLEIKNINIISDDKSVNYKVYSCDECDNNDGVIYIGYDEKLVLELSDPLQIDDIDLEIEFNNPENGVLIMLDYSESFNFDNKKMVAMTRSSTRVSKYHINDTFYKYSNYDDTIYIDYDILEDKYINILSKDEVCRSKELLVYHYDIVRDYYDDDYYKDISDLVDLSETEKLEYIKDLDDFKTYYRYEVSYNEEENAILDIDSKIEVLDNDVSELKLVNTGVDENVTNYKYLNIYILILLLLFVYFVKRIKMSIENNN